MKDIAYGDYGGDDYFYTPGYEALISSMEYDVLLETHDDDYQGDSRYLLYDKEKGYGYLIFGWGSCSGCDALQACDNKQEVEALRDNLVSEIHWEDTKEELLNWVLKRDWDFQHEWHNEKTKEFLKFGIKILGANDYQVAQFLRGEYGCMKEKGI